MRKILLTSVTFFVLGAGSAFAANTNYSTIEQTGSTNIANQIVSGDSGVNGNVQDIQQTSNVNTAGQSVTDTGGGGSTDNDQHILQDTASQNYASQTIDSGNDNEQGSEQHGFSNQSYQAISNGDGNTQLVTQNGDSNLATQTVN